MQSRRRVIFPAVALTLLALAAGCSPQHDPLRPSAAPGPDGLAGGASAAVVRERTGENLPPTVRIVSPVPGVFISPLVPPRTRIHWEGHDPDGADPARLAAYKFRLIPEDSPDFLLCLVFPDSLRRRDGPAFAGWDSVPGDSLAHGYDGLTVNKRYLFVVVGFDEAGASTEDFSLNSNMLNFRVGWPGSAGPLFTVWSDLFRHEFPFGGSIGPALEIHETVPATELEVHWSTRPIPGSHVESYRWAVDIEDPEDESPRRGPVDLRHWSAWDPAGTSATVTRRFPPPPSGARRLFIEASDSYGWVSRVILDLDLATGRHGKP